MADDIGSWIAAEIVKHDKSYGATLSRPWRGARFCQLVEFKTFRDERHPHTQIVGVISDKTHHVAVEFDVDETDRFEEPTPDLPAESLTSHLRAIFQLLSFTFRLERDPSYKHQPGTSPMLELPIIVLEVQKWNVISGDRNDPVFFGDTKRIGRGNSAVDAEVQRVLRKWWFGESYSDPSQNHSSQMDTPSRPPALGSGNKTHHNTPSSLKGKPLMPSPPDTRTVDTSTIPARTRETLASFLRPYLAPTNGKKAKAIPEWIFEKPDDVKRQLEDITMFGLDLSVDVGIPLAEAPEVTNIVDIDPVDDDEIPGGPPAEAFDEEFVTVSEAENEEEREKEESIRVKEEEEPQMEIRSPSPPPAAQRPPPTQIQNEPSSSHPCSQSHSHPTQPSSSHSEPPFRLDEEESEESEEDMPIRPLIKRNIKSKAKEIIFDPLSIPTPSPSEMAAEDEVDIDADEDEEHESEEEEEEEEGLSDYEKEQRRKAKGKARAPEDERDGTRSSDTAPAIPGAVAVEGDESESEDMRVTVEQYSGSSGDKSLSASQQSQVEFSLSRYTRQSNDRPGPAAMDTANLTDDKQEEEEPEPEAADDDADRSMEEKDGEDTELVPESASLEISQPSSSDAPKRSSSQPQPPPSIPTPQMSPGPEMSPGRIIPGTSPNPPEGTRVVEEEPSDLTSNSTSRRQPVSPGASRFPNRPVTRSIEGADDAEIPESSENAANQSTSFLAKRPINHLAPAKDQTPLHMDEGYGSLRKKIKREIDVETPFAAARSSPALSTAGSSASARGSRKSFLSSIKMLWEPQSHASPDVDSPLKGKESGGQATGESGGAGNQARGREGSVLGRIVGWARSLSPDKSTEGQVKRESPGMADDAGQHGQGLTSSLIHTIEKGSGSRPRVKERDFALPPHHSPTKSSAVHFRQPRTRTPAAPSDNTRPAGRTKPIPSASRSARYHPYADSNPRQPRSRSSASKDGADPISSPIRGRKRALPDFEVDLDVDGLTEGYVREALAQAGRYRAKMAGGGVAAGAGAVP